MVRVNRGEATSTNQALTQDGHAPKYTSIFDMIYIYIIYILYIHIFYWVS